MNPTRAHEAAMVDLAQRRIVALEDVRRFEERFESITVNLRKRTVTVQERGTAREWLMHWTIPDPARPAQGAREDRPHDLAAIIKAACRLVGYG